MLLKFHRWRLLRESRHPSLKRLSRLHQLIKSPRSKFRSTFLFYLKETYSSLFPWRSPAYSIHHQTASPEIRPAYRRIDFHREREEKLPLQVDRQAELLPVAVQLVNHQAGFHREREEKLPLQVDRQAELLPVAVQLVNHQAGFPVGESAIRRQVDFPLAIDLAYLLKDWPVQLVGVAQVVAAWSGSEQVLDVVVVLLPE